MNEKSLWSGGPSTSRPNYNGGNIENNGQNGKIVKRIQEAFARGDSSTASSLCNQLTGVSDDAGINGYGYYLSYGNLYLDFEGIADNRVENYRRDLNLRTAVASVEYDHNGTHYTRENFVSYPDNVLVTKVTAKGSDKLNLGQGVSDKTTNQLLAAYNNGTATDAERRQLEVMLFQFGRYLTIESSRETPEGDAYRETLPSNLQGIWVGANNSAWHSDYHMNVNLQMNYWPTYSTNMAECAEPLHRITHLDGPARAGVLTGDGLRQQCHGFFRIVGNIMNLREMQIT